MTEKRVKTTHTLKRPDTPEDGKRQLRGLFQDAQRSAQHMMGKPENNLREGRSVHIELDFKRRPGDEDKPASEADPQEESARPERSRPEQNND